MGFKDEIKKLFKGEAPFVSGPPKKKVKKKVDPAIANLLKKDKKTSVLQQNLKDKKKALKESGGR